MKLELKWWWRWCFSVQESLMRSFRRNVFQLNQMRTPLCIVDYMLNKKNLYTFLSHLAASWDSFQTLMSCYDRIFFKNGERWIKKLNFFLLLWLLVVCLITRIFSSVVFHAFEENKRIFLFSSSFFGVVHKWCQLKIWSSLTL